MITTATAYGLTFSVMAGDTGVGRCLREAGEFGRAELDLMLEACDGDLMDVGANIGALALPFAARRPLARVVAIEAHPGLGALLTRNRDANGLSNVDVVIAVAGEQRGTIEVPVAPLDAEANLGASSLYAKGQPMAPQRMATLDDLAPPRCRFVKVDVEGFEPRVLQGAGRLLNETRPSWLVEVSQHRPNTAARVREMLTAAGYRLFWFFSPWVIDPASDELLGDTALFACDGEPPWPMRPAEEPWPSLLADLPYLARYRAG